MPYITLSTTANPLSKKQKSQLVGETTRILDQILGKNPQVTVLNIVEQSLADWGLAGDVADRQAKNLASLEIRITSGTNSPAEKAAAIKAAYEMLARLLGPLAEACYVMIIEIPADSWGYGGRTQKARQAA